MKYTKSCFTFVFRWAFIVLLIMGWFVPAALSEQSMLLNFEVQPSVLLELPASFHLPSITPGLTTTGNVQVTVKANVNWDLGVKGGNFQELEGDSVELSSVLEVRDLLGHWRELTDVTTYVKSNQPPSPSEGTLVDVELRMIGDFGDPPGSYQTELLFVLVPQL